jgi:riboflavin synthase
VFTGIVEEIGRVARSAPGELAIEAAKALEGTKLGDSIAINGVDLTVVRIDGGVMHFNLMPETYRRSNLGELRPDDGVNLERAMSPQDRFSGHMVRGVVEGVGRIRSFVPETDAVIVTFETPDDLLRHMVVKGPVCVDGISLTIVRKDADAFAVSLVQYTQENTTLMQKPVGATVNLETDIFARYIDQILEERLAALGLKATP